ncbi:hypothetical protein QBC38DRAFT_498594 [Podospora fimiseda]|uniref:BTB domain-containing protein n=1 Tax=Podospora fimiseda TaxID=252190 RepID=A0AAN7BRY8_9PEZI|nr:hypothetical protein QBC38DRAFT_498594 [Podospora fimiseda]
MSSTGSADDAAAKKPARFGAPSGPKILVKLLGSNNHQWEIHENLLRSCSTYFANRIDQNPCDINEINTLEDWVEPATVQMFGEWLYENTAQATSLHPISVVKSPFTKDVFSYLKIYVFAVVYEIPDLSRDAFVRVHQYLTIQEHNYKPVVEQVKYLFDHTKKVT